MKIASIVLTVAAYAAAVIFITIPLVALFSGNWPLAIIGEAKWDLPQWWAANNRLVITGIVLFAALYIPALVLKDRIKAREGKSHTAEENKEENTQERTK